jgi:hypothetical protein
MTRKLPRDLVGGEDQFIGVLADKAEAAKKAASALRDDLTFEHLDHPEDAVWRFVAARL